MPAELKYWTCTERRRAIEMAKQGIPYKEIAKRLGRPYLGVKSYMGRLAKNGMAEPRYTHLEDADVSQAHPVIKRLFQVAARDGYTFDLLAKRSGVSKSAIRDMLRTGNPRFRNILTVAETLNVRLSAVQFQEAA